MQAEEAMTDKTLIRRAAALLFVVAHGTFQEKLGAAKALGDSPSPGRMSEKALDDMERELTRMIRGC